MFSWLADNSGTFLIILALIAAGWAAGWWLHRERKYLIGLGVVAGLMLLVWIIALLVVTDRQLLERNIRALASAVITGKRADFVHHMAPDLEIRGKKRDELIDRFFKEAKFLNATNIHIWDFTVEEVSRSDRKGTAWFGATVHGPEGPLFMGRCKAWFRFQEERWQLQKIQRAINVLNQEQLVDILP